MTAPRHDSTWRTYRSSLIIVLECSNRQADPNSPLRCLALPTAWECVRLLVRQAWQWATLSDMLFHLFVVYLVKPDVTLQIHLRPALAVVLLLCRYTPRH